MAVSGRTSKISAVIATICIFIYIVAIALGVVQIIENNGQRRSLAENEFYDLADRASSSAVFLGFMSEAYQETIKDFIAGSETLLGVIITGSEGEYAFERHPGSGIVWAGDSPRFKTGAGFPGDPFLLYLRIEGQRNVTIQAIYSPFESSLILKVLRNTLLAVLAALAIALITLLAEVTSKNKAAHYRSEESDGSRETDESEEETGESYAADSVPEPDASTGGFVPDRVFVTRHSSKTEYTPVSKWTEKSKFKPEPEEKEDFQVPPHKEEKTKIPVYGSFSAENPPVEEAPDIEIPAEDTTAPDSPSEETPKGLYTQRGNIGWESYTHDRLNSELHRCASFEQDLVFMVMEFKETEGLSDALYREFADEAVGFFGLRDLIFEKGGNGLSVIIPSADLEQGIGKSEEFRNRIIAKMAESIYIGSESLGTQLRIGLSSRSGRLIEADRVLLESTRALEKALEDPSSPIMAFKSDPEKYREFLKGRLQS